MVLYQTLQYMDFKCILLRISNIWLYFVFNLNDQTPLFEHKWYALIHKTKK